tara:strand:+ start:494 stop:685 length:192 start_codon:yes stop_codon:yes gene_type:complete
MMALIRVETVNDENIIVQKIIFLHVLSIGVAYQNTEGTHISFNCGFGPIEFDWTIRLWNHWNP